MHITGFPADNLPDIDSRSASPVMVSRSAPVSTGHSLLAASSAVSMARWRAGWDSRASASCHPAAIRSSATSQNPRSGTDLVDDLPGLHGVRDVEDTPLRLQPLLGVLLLLDLETARAERLAEDEPPLPPRRGRRDRGLPLQQQSAVGGGERVRRREGLELLVLEHGHGRGGPVG